MVGEWRDGKGRGYQRESPLHRSGLNGKKKLYEAGRVMWVGTVLLLESVDLTALLRRCSVYDGYYSCLQGVPREARFIDFPMRSGLTVEEYWENV